MKVRLEGFGADAKRGLKRELFVVDCETGDTVGRFDFEGNAWVSINPWGADEPSSELSFAITEALTARCERESEAVALLRRYNAPNWGGDINAIDRDTDHFLARIDMEGK